MGTPKQLLPYLGSSLLRRAAATAAASCCHPIVAVLGAFAAQCLPELQDLTVSSVENSDWAEGMGSSIRVGLNTLFAQSPTSVDAVILMVCDQPLLQAAHLEALIRVYRASPCRAVASEYGGTSGVPALFDQTLFPELLGLTGAQGAKSLLHRYSDATRWIAFPDGAIDIDTPADYERFNCP